MFSALLAQAGSSYLHKKDLDKANSCNLNALSILLEALNRFGIHDLPNWTPKIEDLLTVLKNDPLPVGIKSKLETYNTIFE